MEDHITTGSGSEAPLSQLLGFEDGDYVSVATHGVKRATTMPVEDLDFDSMLGLDQIDTWIGAQPVKPETEGRAKAGDVATVRVLYADFDYKDADEPSVLQAITELSNILEALPISIVNSGGGLHPRWKLEEPIAPEDAEGILRRWKLTVMRVAEEHGFKADSVFDLPRVLRLPGTVNTKYDPPRETSIEVGNLESRVAKKALWTRLDTAAPKEKPKPPAGTPSMTKAPERAEISDTLNERAVNAAIRRELEILHRLAEDGWDGDPWHNTTRDVAYRMAKIALSPNTSQTEDEVYRLFFDNAPRDDEDFDDEKIEQLWQSGLEKADGEEYELIGSGDEIYEDDFKELASNTLAMLRRDIDSDPDLAFDSPDVVSTEKVEVESSDDSRERYDALRRPLMPGLQGIASLRKLPLTSVHDSVQVRIKVIGENLSDRHSAEHMEYMHPHCPECFPGDWSGHMARWLVLHPGGNPEEFRPPVGGMAPDEGYLSPSEVLARARPSMIIEGYIPAGAVGVIIGQGSAGKSFIAVDMALAIADPDRIEWQDPFAADDAPYGSVHQKGKVLIMAGESYGGIAERVRAGAGGSVMPDWVDENIVIRGAVPNMAEGGDDFEAMLRYVHDMKPELVIIDTLQKAAGGADQNNASEIGAINRRLAQVRDAMDGGTVAVIAHTGKADESARGSSAIEDDADFVLHVTEQEGGQRNLHVKKMRDGRPAPDFEFHIVPTEDGSAVVQPLQSRTLRPISPAKIQAVGRAMLSYHQAEGFDTEMPVTKILKMANQDPLLPKSEEIKERSMYDALFNMMEMGRAVRSTKGNYRLTAKGEAWLRATPGNSVFTHYKEE